MRQGGGEAHLAGNGIQFRSSNRAATSGCIAFLEKFDPLPELRLGRAIGWPSN